jgi:DNA-binding NarL/FixJ family response regulator
VPGNALAGRRVLLLEDEMLISLLIEDVLERQGCAIVGPFSRVASALSAAATEMIDVAILDINVAGDKSFPVAEALNERNIPFFFLSGYGQAAAPSDRPEWIVCGKPFQESEIIATLLERLGQ